jgi:hypothetical protein
VVRYTLAANSTPAETEIIDLDDLRTLGQNTHLRTQDIGPATGAVISPPNTDDFDSEGLVWLGIVQVDTIVPLQIDTDTQAVTMQINQHNLMNTLMTRIMR